MEPSKAVKKYKDENKELYLKLDIMSPAKTTKSRKIFIPKLLK